MGTRSRRHFLATAGAAAAGLAARRSRAASPAGPGRVTSLHVKDVRRGSEPTWRFAIQTCRIGQGALDWPRLLRAARAAGVERGFVELEPPFVGHTALEDAAAAHAYLGPLAG
jgi:sugar phosphate isomerase/epimerase